MINRINGNGDGFLFPSQQAAMQQKIDELESRIRALQRLVEQVMLNVGDHRRELDAIKTQQNQGAGTYVVDVAWRREAGTGATGDGSAVGASGGGNHRLDDGRE